MAGYASKTKSAVVAGVLAFSGFAMVGSASAAAQCDQRGCYTVRCDSYGYCNRASGYEGVNESANGPAYEQKDYVRTHVCDTSGCRDVFEPRVRQNDDDQGY
ncbi:MAG TPA: hypothetical protein VGG10_17210 [Rhizomicrobium sp.]